MYLYHKGDLGGVKQDMRTFRDSFMNRNPECNSVDSNWHSLKETLTVSVSNHVPKKKLKSRKDLPWLTRDIKRAMKNSKKLFDHAKQHNTEESWSNYRRARNRVNKALQIAHE